MDKVTTDHALAWNFRGLKGPNKQEAVHDLLRFNKCSFVGLVETKIALIAYDEIKRKLCPKWRHIPNATNLEKGRIWIL